MDKVKLKIEYKSRNPLKYINGINSKLLSARIAARKCIMCLCIPVYPL